MQIDIQKSALDNVIDLINITNGTSLTDAIVEIGTPSEWVDPEGLNTRNTELSVSAKAGSGYTGSVPVRFTRLDLTGFPSAGTLEYTLTGTDTVGDILSAVATQLGVLEEAVELDITEVPVVAEGATVTINILATVGSLLYVGQAPVTVFPNTTDLNDEVTQSDLDGFDEPVA